MEQVYNCSLQINLKEEENGLDTHFRIDATGKEHMLTIVLNNLQPVYCQPNKTKVYMYFSLSKVWDK